MTPPLFVPVVSAAGLLVIGHCVSTLVGKPVAMEWVALAVLTLFTGSLTIKIPSVAARLSVSETFVFASVLLFGTCAGTITVALEVMIAVAMLGRSQRPDPHKIIFNVASASLSIWLAGTAFYYAAGTPPLSTYEAPLSTLLIPLAILSSTYFLLNSGLIAVALSHERKISALTIWRVNFSGLGINYFAGASLAALFVSYTRTIDLFALSVIVPLLLVSYLTFKTSLGRIEDATQHVEKVKRLYLSTIETLATAIDAKDQVTHGHIRRVQHIAVSLARDIGVTDRLQLEALEAAALLHDTGKLAIPEHILNKPGKLTPGEFETMKTHARIGADILSSIEFPFPVVPIVRHHHENWDGSGYPDGLRSTEIPIGARILAVVDCFDALTSDRPYRPAMNPEKALSILLQRRGTMYDPLIVDAFASSWQDLVSTNIERVQEPSAPRQDLLRAAVRLPAQDNHPPPVSTSLHGTLAEALEKTGAKLAVLFAIDRNNDCIVAKAVSTSAGPARASMRIPLGCGVSGWVAVNLSTIVNADASLDSPTMAAEQSLVRIMCVPVKKNEETLGVLSVYSSDPRGFSDDDRLHIEKTVASLEVAGGIEVLTASSHDTARGVDRIQPTVH